MVANPFARVGAVVRRDAVVAMSYPLSFWTNWISVIVSISGFYFVAKFLDPAHHLVAGEHAASYFSYVSVNLSFMLLQSTALQAFANGVRLDQLLGTLEPIVDSGTGFTRYVASLGIWPLAVSAAQVVLSLAFASMLGLDLRGTNLATLAIFVVLAVACMSGLGLMSAAAVIAFKQTPPSAYLVGGAATMLSGALFPVGLLPLPIRAISWLLPITHALAGMRGAIGGASPAALGGEIEWLLAASALLVPLSLWTVHLAVERSKRDGSLAHY